MSAGVNTENVPLGQSAPEEKKSKHEAQDNVVNDDVPLEQHAQPNAEEIVPPEQNAPVVNPVSSPVVEKNDKISSKWSSVPSQGRWSYYRAMCS